MDTFADDLSELVETLDLTGAFLIGFSTHRSIRRGACCSFWVRRRAPSGDKVERKPDTRVHGLPPSLQLPVEATPVMETRACWS